MPYTGELFELDGEVWEALSGSRLSQVRTDRIRDALRRRRDRERHLEAEVRRYKLEANDLRLHLRDRDQYVRNLEAQLRPYLLAGGPEPQQEALA
jgi:hypothetical protein